MPLLPPAVSAFAAIAISKKRRRILRAFRDAEATSTTRARRLEDIGLSPSLLVEIQKLRGVLIEAEDGHYFLDETREAEVDGLRKKLAVAIVVVVLVGAVAAWYLGARSAP